MNRRKQRLTPTDFSTVCRGLLFDKFLFIIPFYHRFRLCITNASGLAHTPILLCIIRRNTNELGFRIYTLRVLHSHRGYELYGR